MQTGLGMMSCWGFSPRWVPMVALLAMSSLVSCSAQDPPGTPENLKADYDRAIREREQLKVDYESQKQELERNWRQRVIDKDQKITELTRDNANLRQRLLTVEAAIDEVPLVNSANDRSFMWLHLVYGIIILAFLGILAVVLWVHGNLRERVRLHLMQHARLAPRKEIYDVETSTISR
jgi:hypothetical protein